MDAALSAKDILSLRPQFQNEPQPDELPAALEHVFSQGMMVDHYFVKFAPVVLQDADVAALGSVSDVLLVQSPENAQWTVHFHEATMVREVSFSLSDEEMQQILQQNQLTLPG